MALQDGLCWDQPSLVWIHRQCQTQQGVGPQHGWGIVLLQAGGSPRAGWRRWRRFAAIVATWQARLLYSVVYVLLIIPLGMLLRWRSDPLRQRRALAGRTVWRVRSEPPDLQQWARRQF